MYISHLKALSKIEKFHRLFYYVIILLHLNICVKFKFFNIAFAHVGKNSCQ